MTPTAQCIALARASGWEYCPETGFTRFHDEPRANHSIPDYLNDLNATHEIEMLIKSETDKSNDGKYYAYCEELEQVAGHWECSSATAAQRSETLLKVLNLWDDTK